MTLKARITRLITRCTAARDPVRATRRAYLRVNHIARRKSPHLLHLAIALQYHCKILHERANYRVSGSAVRINDATRLRDRYLSYYGFTA